MKCPTNDHAKQVILLRVNNEWVPYTGTTGTRKLLYRAVEAQRAGRGSMYVCEYGHRQVTGIIFPAGAHKEMRSIPTEAHKQTQFFFYRRRCKIITLGNGAGKLCTHCGQIMGHQDVWPWVGSAEE